MGTGEKIVFFVLLLLSVGSFVVSIFHFREKGPLFNNAYLYGSEEERKRMNKKPHYRQSAVVFCLLGIIFLLNTLEMITKTGWLFYGGMVIAVIVIVYAIISSIGIERNKYK